MQLIRVSFSTYPIPASSMAGWGPGGHHRGHHCTRFPWSPPRVYNKPEEVYCLFYFSPVFHHSGWRASKHTSARMDSWRQWVLLWCVSYQPSRGPGTLSCPALGGAHRGSLGTSVSSVFQVCALQADKPVESNGNERQMAVPGMGSLVSGKSSETKRNSLVSAMWSAFHLAGFSSPRFQLLIPSPSSRTPRQASQPVPSLNLPKASPPEPPWAPWLCVVSI